MRSGGGGAGWGGRTSLMMRGCESEQPSSHRSNNEIDMTYAWWRDGWWLKEANLDVLRVSLNAACSGSTDDLWVRISEKALRIGSVLLHLCDGR